MRNPILFLFAFLSFILFIGCENQSSSGPEQLSSLDLAKAENALTEADNIFGIKLFKTVVADTQNVNIFISPLSVSMALGMTLNGANGATYDAMQSTLEYGDLTNDEINQSYRHIMEILTTLDPKVVFEIANSIWYREGMQVEEEFINNSQQYFDAAIESIDFSNPGATDIINNWISDNTHNKITNVIRPPISRGTMMFLINAIYFLGSWTYEFNPDYTEIETFLLEDGNRVDCQIMSHRNEHLYFQNQTCQGVDLPYGDGKFRMMIILPNENIHIDSLIDQLDNDTWNSWLSQFEPTDINLYLPKFKLEYKHQLNRVLKSMGMSIAFSSQADFSRIESGGGLYISKVLHKTFIDVNEEGTEAAAVTFVVMDRGSSSDNPRIPTMWINHPFIFAIHEVESETILFIGKIIQPEYED